MQTNILFTITSARKTVMAMSEGYLTLDKTILVAQGKKLFISLQNITKSSVHVMYNPSDTNEKFVKEQIPNAQLIVNERTKFPNLIEKGKAGT
jgi:cyclohexadienyl dehydratase